MPQYAALLIAGLGNQDALMKPNKIALLCFSATARINERLFITDARIYQKYKVCICASYYLNKWSPAILALGLDELVTMKSRNVQILSVMSYIAANQHTSFLFKCGFQLKHHSWSIQMINKKHMTYQCKNILYLKTVFARLSWLNHEYKWSDDILYFIQSVRWRMFGRGICAGTFVLIMILYMFTSIMTIATRRVAY